MRLNQYYVKCAAFQINHENIDNQRHEGQKYCAQTSIYSLGVVACSIWDDILGTVIPQYYCVLQNNRMMLLSMEQWVIECASIASHTD